MQVLGVNYVMQAQPEDPVASCPKPSVHSSTIVEVGGASTRLFRSASVTTSLNQQMSRPILREDDANFGVGVVWHRRRPGISSRRGLAGRRRASRIQVYSPPSSCKKTAAL